MRGAWPVLAAALLGLSACGDLPHPFLGRLGAAGQKLVVPPPARLAVPGDPAQGEAGKVFAASLAAVLVKRGVPAVAGPAHPGDWQLRIGSKPEAGLPRPHFVVFDPAGHARGATDGAVVTAGLWREGTKQDLASVANADSGAIATLLRRIRLADEESNPNSLVNRAPRLAFLGVSGAPGDGNHSLALAMEHDLPMLGLSLQKRTVGADFTLSGKVMTAPAGAGQIEVEIDWMVADARGRSLGKVVQLHDLQAGTVSGYWGDVAAVAAGEAANGVKTVIDNAIHAP